MSPPSCVAEKNVRIISMKKRPSMPVSSQNWSSPVFLTNATLNGTTKAVYNKSNTMTKSQIILNVLEGRTMHLAFLNLIVSEFYLSYIRVLVLLIAKFKLLGLLNPSM